MAGISTPRDPARNAFVVTPSDSTILTVGRAIWVGTGGNIAVLMAGDESSVSLLNVPSGVLLPLSVSQVLSTGTTASDMVILY